MAKAKRHRRRRNQKRAIAGTTDVLACLTRRVPPCELLDETALVELENHAEWLLPEISIEIRDDPVALELFREAGVGTNFLGVDHTLRHYKTANYRASLCDASSFEQWSETGGKDMQRRAFERWQRLLAEYQAPPIDPAIDEALLEFIASKKASMDDAWY